MARTRTKPQKLRNIEERHSRSCAAPEGRCSCTPSYRVVIRDGDGSKVTKTFLTAEEAMRYRDKARVAVHEGRLRAATSPLTLRQACEAMLARMEAGTMPKSRGEGAYKPSTVRLYRQVLEDHVYGALGSARLVKVTRSDIQRMLDQVPADRDGSTVRNVLAPLRVVFNQAVLDESIAASPIHHMKLRPKRNARPATLEGASQVKALIAVARAEDRAMFGVMFIAGLRLGEVQALRWKSVDLANSVLRVSDSYDPKERAFVGPKTEKSNRTVHFGADLRDLLTEHRAACTWRDNPEGLVFGRTEGAPRHGSTSLRHLKAAAKAAGLPDVHHHGGRHTAASAMLQDGVPLGVTSDYLGHSSITVTGDIYRHALPGQGEIIRTYQDAAFARADTEARIAALDARGDE